MNPSAVLRSERLRPLTRLMAAWGVWAALGLAAASPLRAFQASGPMTPAGTVVNNEATVTFSTENGGDVVAVGSASFTVGQIAGVDIEPIRVSVAQPGTDVVFTHTLMNVGNGTDSFDVVAASTSGWSTLVYHDVDGDRLLTATDTLITGPVSLVMGASYDLLVVVTVPTSVVPGHVDMIDVSATSQFDGTTTDSVTDEIRFIDVNVNGQIEKSVDVAEASPDDLLTYLIRVRLEGAGQRDSVSFRDRIPAFAMYEAGTLQLDGVNLTDASDADAGSYQAATGIVTVDLSSLPSGTDANILFQVRIGPSTPVGTQIANRADLAIHTPLGTIDEESAPAVTNVAAPQLQITKSVLGLEPATAEDSLVYTIEVSNPSSALSALNLEVVDTLPDPLVLRGTTPAATLSGRELRWTVARLGPGETARFEIVAEVPEVTDSLTVINRAHLLRDGATGEFADSELRTLMPSIEASLALDLEAEVVEIRLGEVLPLRTTVANDGEATVTDVLVKLALPIGTRFIDQPLEGSFIGFRAAPALTEGPGGPALAPGPGQIETALQLDSTIVIGDTLYVTIPGELRPQESIEFRYLLMVDRAPEGVLLNTAIAEARRGTLLAVSALVVASNEAQVLVGLSRNRALETRTVIGKVFHDINGDGYQDPDEPGIPYVDVVTADGEMVTTDEFGKLSFNDLRPGRHAFRVDPLSIPEDLALRTAGPGQRFQVLEINGWNSPRLVFALVSRPGGAPAPDGADGDGGAATPRVGPDVRISPLRSEEERAADQRSAFLRGPALSLTTPADGFVSATNRVYIGVEGEPMRPIALFRGDSLLVEGQLLPNGVGDFVGVELQYGPQVFRIRTLNTWNNESWDSLLVHQTGPPVRIEPEEEHLVVSADGRTTATTRVRLFDEWGVPVVHEPFVTVRMDGGRFLGADVDASSVGHQLQADRTGWVTIEFVGGRNSGKGALLVEVPDADITIPVTMLPPVRPLLLTGVGQVSVGSGGDAFGAVTAQGRIGNDAALTLSYDTRRLDQGREEFGRSFDPLDEGRNPIIGDASSQRSLTPSRYRFSARVERGLDWMMFGDVQTSGFSDGMDLARYGRALPGAAARLTTGSVVWNAFGASTTQSLRQQQIRGFGSSGPFELGSGVLPGTEEVLIQVRALENPTRVVSEQLLTRYAEYQIDYTRGTLLLKQPVPASDPFGNPVFLVVSYEGESGGDHSPVWGVRATSQLGGLVGDFADSIPVSVSIVSDSEPGRSFRLGALRTGMKRESGLEVSAELAMADGSDSTGVATRIKGSSPFMEGRLKVSAEWTRVGDEFHNPANIGLRPGTNEVRANGALEVGEGRVTVAHDRQSFASRDLSRNRTTLGYAQTVVEDVKVDARIAGDASKTADASTSSGAGEYRVTWSAAKRLDVFAEGRNQLWSNGTGLANRGSYYGGGASFKLTRSFAVEGRHLRVTPGGDANPYNMSSVGLTSNLRVGTKAWGSYQISGGIDGQTNAAVVGLNHRFSIGPDFRFSTMIERRKGVGGASFGDPVLASPFDRPEENYTSASFGTEYVPQSKPYRLSLRAERRDGNLSSSQLATLAGDVAFGSAFALLSRQEYVERDLFGSLTTRYTRERSSLWGLAYRPTMRDDLNILFKFGWKDAVNPFGSGVLASDGAESRLIGAMEAIWAPRGDMEFGARFATRSTSLDAEPLAGVPITTRNQTDFVGARARLFAKDWVAVEIEARGMLSDLVAGSTWDVAPSVVVRPMEALEVELGYRFGDLQDPDFAVRSGSGFFLTLGTRITEDLIPSAADFWRSRFGG